jgi:hypothetical protein
MKDCLKCKHAKWDRTAAGRLHPKGGGQCTYTWKLPPLPASMYWISRPPQPLGGFIQRNKLLPDHCPYWAEEAPSDPR